MDLKQVFDCASIKGLAAKMNDGSVIYKGLKFYEDKVLCTDKMFYEDVSDWFNNFDQFDEAVRCYLSQKYKKKIDIINNEIKYEVNRHNNHNKIIWLKSERNHYLNKYNEISTQETTRR